MTNFHLFPSLLSFTKSLLSLLPWAGRLCSYLSFNCRKGCSIEWFMFDLSGLTQQLSGAHTEAHVGNTFLSAATDIGISLRQGSSM